MGCLLGICPGEGEPMRLIILVLSLILNVSVAQAYTPPIGIPDPGFGIDDVRPARPDPWTSEIAGYYYIDLTSGNDTGRTYGYPGTSRKTIPNPVPAGSYVEVHGATAVSGTNLIVTCSGTSAAWSAGVAGPVWILGESVETRPNFLRPLLITGAYAYLDTLYFSGGNGSIQIGSSTAGYPADHVTVRNSEVQGAVGVLKGAFAVKGTVSDPVSNVVAYNNHFHHTDDQDYAEDTADVHITTVGTYSSNIWILDNEINNSSGSGGQILATALTIPDTHHIYYGRNHVYNTRQAGLAVKYGTDMVMSQNTIHDVGNTAWSESKGVGYQYGPNKLWILYNHIYNCKNGVHGGSTDTSIDPLWRIYLIGNLIHDITAIGTYDPENSWAEAGMMLAGGHEKYIVNNTFYNVVGGIYIPGNAVFVENNIISNVTGTGGYHLFVDTGTSRDASDVRNNIFYQDVGDEHIKWSSTYVGDVAYMLANTGEFTGSLATDPLFISSSDFHLQASSPAKDSAVLSGVYATFQALYGIDIKKDIAGTTRPINALWDIGAYEYNEATAPQSMGTVLLGQ